MICLIHPTEIKTMNYKLLEEQKSKRESFSHRRASGYVASLLAFFFIPLLKKCFYLLPLRATKCLPSSKLCADCFLRS